MEYLTIHFRCILKNVLKTGLKMTQWMEKDNQDIKYDRKCINKYFKPKCI